MKVALIARSTLLSIPGGDTTQILQTARFLKGFGVHADILFTHKNINYEDYDLLHFFNITRPADILYHIHRTNKPTVLSPILIDYSEYDKLHRKGLSGMILKRFSADRNEYIKTISRWMLGKDKLRSGDYLWKGHTKSIDEILRKISIVLPNCESELLKAKSIFPALRNYRVVPYGIDPDFFQSSNGQTKDSRLIICAARIEGIKNQVNLVKALNNTHFTLLLIGSPAPNQKKYYNECRNIAAKNVFFMDHMPRERLIEYYKKAKVHVLPSWFETCGLSSLEAAVMGCNIVISEKGFTRDYFGSEGFYCDPGDPVSIYNAVEKAANSSCCEELRKRILENYTWQNAVTKTIEAYKTIVH